MYNITATVGGDSNYLAARAAGEPVLQVKETELGKVWRQPNQSSFKLNGVKTTCSNKNEKLF